MDPSEFLRRIHEEFLEKSQEYPFRKYLKYFMVNFLWEFSERSLHELQKKKSMNYFLLKCFFNSLRTSWRAFWRNPWAHPRTNTFFEAIIETPELFLEIPVGVSEGNLWRISFINSSKKSLEELLEVSVEKWEIVETFLGEIL